MNPDTTNGVTMKLYMISTLIFIHLMLITFCMGIGYSIGHDIQQTGTFDPTWVIVVTLMVLFERIALGLIKEITGLIKEIK